MISYLHFFDTVNYCLYCFGFVFFVSQIIKKPVTF